MPVPHRALALFGVILCGCGGGGAGAEANDASADGSMTEASSNSPGTSGCEPLAGCSSTTRCPAPDGCNTCECVQNAWACTGYACIPDAATSNVDCLDALDQQGACRYVGSVCTEVLGSGEPCAFITCQCDPGHTLQCQGVDCRDGGALGPPYPYPYPYGPSSCPEEEPVPSSSCSQSNALCGFGACSTGKEAFGTTCLCVSGTWICAPIPGCGDAGTP